LKGLPWALHKYRKAFYLDIPKSTFAIPHLRDGLWNKPPILFEELLCLLLCALYCPAPRATRARSIGREKELSGDFSLFPQNEEGPAGAPTRNKTDEGSQNAPSHSMKARAPHDFEQNDALGSGPGGAEHFSSALDYLEQSGGQTILLD
jgi:hypothetical protein